MSEPSPRGEDLEKLQRDAVGYFLRAANPENGLIADSSRPGAPCSIAATGLGLAAYRRRRGARLPPASRGRRADAGGAALLPRQPAGRGAGRHRPSRLLLPLPRPRDRPAHLGCELSMIDTAILIAGVLTSGRYFSAAADDEREIRQLARLPLRADRLALGRRRRRRWCRWGGSPGPGS